MLAEWIDPLLLPLRKADPEFYARYQAARDIVDRPATRASAQSEPANVVVSSRVRATSTRARSTYAAGVLPTSSRNTRAKWRGLIDTRAASRSTV